jgi:hypothetical protein
LLDECIGFFASESSGCLTLVEAKRASGVPEIFMSSGMQKFQESAHLLGRCRRAGGFAEGHDAVFLLDGNPAARSGQDPRNANLQLSET